MYLSYVDSLCWCFFWRYFLKLFHDLIVDFTVLRFAGYVVQLATTVPWFTEVVKLCLHFYLNFPVDYAVSAAVTCTFTAELEGKVISEFFLQFGLACVKLL